MRKSIYSILTTFLLIACNSDLEKVHYNASDAKAAVLRPIESIIVLNAQQSDHTAIEFIWNNPIVNYPAAVSTDLQMDIQENNFVFEEALQKSIEAYENELYLK